MKRSVALLMLLISITVNLCAQTSSPADKAFEVPDNIIISRRFNVSLDKGNKMKIELSAFVDLERVANIDSLLQVFLSDIAPLKDSLADPLTSKRIDYMTDAQGRKKIRFQQFQQKGASFLINKGELASLRTGQDTIHLIGIIANPAAETKDKISRHNPRYYHFTFYLNDMNELSDYMNGVLKEKISTIQKNLTGKWPLILGTGSHYLKIDSTITADKARGVTQNAFLGGCYLTLNFSVNIQNYKNYFVPAFSLGTKLTVSNRDRTFKWEPGLFWEPHFIFARDNQNKLRTYRNDFLTLNYAQGGTRDHDPKKDFSFAAVFSLGYLIHRDGEYFDKNTFRLGGGKIQMLKTNVEPCLYFNNFFKGVTPGIRITQYF
jgi:hypothetical protein